MLPANNPGLQQVKGNSGFPRARDPADCRWWWGGRGTPSDTEVQGPLLGLGGPILARRGSQLAASEPSLGAGLGVGGEGTEE